MIERELLKREFSDREYRYAYCEAYIDTEIAVQVVRLRKERQLSQGELAALVGTKQPAISRAEDVNYQGWKVETLKQYARALGVHLLVKFVSQEDMLNEIATGAEQKG